MVLMKACDQTCQVNVVSTTTAERGTAGVHVVLLVIKNDMFFVLAELYSPGVCFSLGLLSITLYNLSK